MARQRDRREATFLEHLDELRQRIIRCFFCVVGGTAVCWFARKTLMSLALAPLLEAGQLAGVGEVSVKLFGIAEGLMMSLNVAMVGGVILSAPFWLLQLWLFVEPALEDHERKWVVPILPASVLLFVTGVGFCYWLSPRAFSILLKFQHDLGAAPEFMLPSYLSFFLRLLLIFGAMFEMPLVIMFLAAVGLVRASWLLRYWRHAIVVIALLAAILTPTPDAITMSLLAGPLIGLYFVSIGLARLVEKSRDKRLADERAAEATASADATPDVPTVPEPDPYAAYETSHLAEAETSVPEVPASGPPPAQDAPASLDFPPPRDTADPEDAGEQPEPRSDD